MIRFLEGVLCGVLIGAVGLGPIKAAALQVGETIVELIQHFS